MKSCMWEGRSLPLSPLHQLSKYSSPSLHSLKEKYSSSFSIQSSIRNLLHNALISPIYRHPRLTPNRIFTLRRKTTLEKTGITHIVSVLKYDFKDFEDWEKYEHLNIEVDDVEDENLLGEFENTGKWIEEGLKNGKDGKKGGVLVHW
jgi:hypothetical protein